MMTDLIPEKARRILAAVAQWGGWLASLGILSFSAATYDDPHIPGTTARSRMRLSESILDALKVGIQSQREEARRIARTLAEKVERDAVALVRDKEKRATPRERNGP
jgi:hypothetical protein